jgi:hypothetical protein
MITEPEVQHRDHKSTPPPHILNTGRNSQMTSLRSTPTHFPIYASLFQVVSFLQHFPPPKKEFLKFSINVHACHMPHPPVISSL